MFLAQLLRASATSDVIPQPNASSSSSSKYQWQVNRTRALAAERKAELAFRNIQLHALVHEAELSEEESESTGSDVEGADNVDQADADAIVLDAAGTTDTTSRSEMRIDGDRDGTPSPQRSQHRPGSSHSRRSKSPLLEADEEMIMPWEPPTQEQEEERQKRAPSISLHSMQKISSPVAWKRLKHKVNLVSQVNNFASMASKASRVEMGLDELTEERLSVKRSKRDHPLILPQAECNPVLYTEIVAEHQTVINDIIDKNHQYWRRLATIKERKSVTFKRHIMEQYRQYRALHEDQQKSLSMHEKLREWQTKMVANRARLRGLVLKRSSIVSNRSKRGSIQGLEGFEPREFEKKNAPESSSVNWNKLSKGVLSHAPGELTKPKVSQLSRFQAAAALVAFEQVPGNQFSLVDDFTNAHRLDLPIRQGGVMKPTCKFVAWRDFLSFLGALFLMFLLPFPAFVSPALNNPYMLAFTYVLDASLVFHMASQCFEAYTDTFGELVCDVDKIRARLYQSTHFWADGLSVIPWEIVPLCMGYSYFDSWLVNALRLNRVLRFHRVVSYERFAAFKFVTRLVRLFFALVLTTHWMGSMFMRIGNAQSRSNPWTGGPWLRDQNLHEAEWRTQYMNSVYFVLTTILTTGFGDIVPITNLEKGVVILLIIFGAMYYTMLFGNVSVLISIRMRSFAVQQFKNIRLTAFINSKHITEDLAERMRFAMHSLETVTQGVRFNSVTSRLSDRLRGQVMLHLCSQLLVKVRYFQNIDDLGFQRALVLRFTHQLFDANDIVVEQGWYAYQMFFVNHGLLHIIKLMSNGDKEHIGSVQRGDHFGEIGLLFDQRRTATVVTATVADLFALSRVDFDECMSLFPRFRKRILDMALDDIAKKAAADAARHVKAVTKPSVFLRSMLLSREQTRMGADGAPGMDRSQSQMGHQALGIKAPMCSCTDQPPAPCKLLNVKDVSAFMVAYKALKESKKKKSLKTPVPDPNKPKEAGDEENDETVCTTFYVCRHAHHIVGIDEEDQLARLQRKKRQELLGAEDSDSGESDASDSGVRGWLSRQSMSLKSKLSADSKTSRSASVSINSSKKKEKALPSYMRATASSGKRAQDRAASRSSRRNTSVTSRKGKYDDVQIKENVTRGHVTDLGWDANEKEQQIGPLPCTFVVSHADHVKNALAKLTASNMMRSSKSRRSSLIRQLELTKKVQMNEGRVDHGHATGQESLFKAAAANSGAAYHAQAAEKDPVGTSLHEAVTTVAGPAVGYREGEFATRAHEQGLSAHSMPKGAFMPRSPEQQYASLLNEMSEEFDATAEHDEDVPLTKTEVDALCSILNRRLESLESFVFAEKRAQAQENDMWLKLLKAIKARPQLRPGEVKVCECIGCGRDTACSLTMPAPQVDADISTVSLRPPRLSHTARTPHVSHTHGLSLDAVPALGAVNSKGVNASAGEVSVPALLPHHAFSHIEHVVPSIGGKSRSRPMSPVRSTDRAHPEFVDSTRQLATVPLTLSSLDVDSQATLKESEQLAARHAQDQADYDAEVAAEAAAVAEADREMAEIAAQAARAETNEKRRLAGLPPLEEEKKLPPLERPVTPDNVEFCPIFTVLESGDGLRRARDADGVFIEPYEEVDPKTGDQFVTITLRELVRAIHTCTEVIENAAPLVSPVLPEVVERDGDNNDRGDDSVDDGNASSSLPALSDQFGFASAEQNNALGLDIELSAEDAEVMRLTQRQPVPFMTQFNMRSAVSTKKKAIAVSRASLSNTSKSSKKKTRNSTRKSPTTVGDLKSPRPKTSDARIKPSRPAKSSSAKKNSLT